MTLSITILQAFLLIYASGVGLLQIGIPLYSLLFAIVSLLLDIPLFYLLFKIKKNIKANMNYLLLQEEYKKMFNSYKSNNNHEDKIRFLRHDIINYLTSIHHYDSEERKPL
ncbi:MAG: hypothetical protein PHQ89_04950 [Bacilli bacterium]|nr:hypothetical protein [Bacilli bacterium]